MQTVDFRYVSLNPGDRVLDLGCGEGRHAIAACCEAPVQSVGIDLSLEDLRAAGRKFASAPPTAAGGSFSLAAANGLLLPFNDATFDVVICSEVLEHIPDYLGVLREIERVMVPGGTFIASVPRAWPEKICWRLSREYHEVAGGHLRIFDAAELRNDIENHGFSWRRRHWAHALHAPFWWLKCLFWGKHDTSMSVRLYHRLLVWDLMQRPWLTRTVEKLLNPLVGKSVVMYFSKTTRESPDTKGIMA